MVGVFGDSGRPPAGTIGDSGDVGRPPARTIEDSGDGGRPPARVTEHSDDVGRRPARVAKSHIGAASEAESCWQETIGRTDPRPKSGAHILKSPVKPKGLRIQHRSDWIRPLPLAPIFPEAEAIPIYIGIDRMGMADAHTHGGGPPEARR